MASKLSQSGRLLEAGKKSEAASLPQAGRLPEDESLPEAGSPPEAVILHAVEENLWRHDEVVGKTSHPLPGR